MCRCPYCDCENPAGTKTCRNCRAELPDADDPAPTDDSELSSLIQKGQKIAAIKLYRERTGANLKEAVDAIEALQRGEQIERRDPNASADDPEIVSLLQAGKKIAAIKLYREKTGARLAPAKAAVEALASQRGIQFPRSGCAGVVLLGAVICLVAARLIV
jgi:ribosomal protein L7/L12